MRALRLVLLALITGSLAHASMSDDSVRGMAKAAVRDFRRVQQMIGPGSQCEQVLINAQIRGGRRFTVADIDQLLDSVLQVTGESLVDLKLPVLTGGEFQQLDHVLTPNGPVSVRNLRVGDEVLSFADGQLVLNRVRSVYLNASQDPPALAFLANYRHVPVEQIIWCTPRAVCRVGDLKHDEQLLKLEIKQPNLGPVHTHQAESEVGSWLYSRTDLPAFILELQHAPNNVIVDGYVLSTRPRDLSQLPTRINGPTGTEMLY